MLGFLGTLLLAALAVEVEDKPADGGRRARCGQTDGLNEVPCLDRAQWHNFTRNLGEGIVTSHDESILVGPSTFDKIRDSHLHACVLKKIFEFYHQVLDRQGAGYDDLWHEIARLSRCVLRNILDSVMQIAAGLLTQTKMEHAFNQKLLCLRRCKKFYKEAHRTSMDETRRWKTLTAKEVAILQIHKLRNATERLGDVSIQEKAVMELSTLDFYLPEEKTKNAQTEQKCATDSQRN